MSAVLPVLTRDHACVRGMNWRFDLPPAAIEAALDALPSAGFLPCPSPEALPSFQSPEGHRVLLVRRTGRAQIRVSYTVPEGQRRLAAEAVFTAVVRALRPAGLTAW
ncbi:MAG: hypothetical protein MUF64_06400 [Polyangiaceae bacterium]|jgi:hypothetical protein|nr:hypothetical protein [Polyangiaceae bacterium]